MINLKKYWRKGSYFVLTIVVSTFVSVLFQPVLGEKTLDFLVSTYSILAGFLIGVIALIGDPSSLPSGSWRVAESATKNTFRRLQSTRNLLYVYLLTLLGIFLYKLAATSEFVKLVQSWESSDVLLPVFVFLKRAVEHSILFLSAVAFSYSLTLPNSLFKIQRRRVEKEIEARREKDNIK
ncbi:hypothetical protein [Vibrio chagasii]|uniref:hypothetical protein n=1 Tax=Vibrio chagasii TaxID=170679 RepID=UPI003734EFA2